MNAPATEAGKSTHSETRHKSLKTDKEKVLKLLAKLSFLQLLNGTVNARAWEQTD